MSAHFVGHALRELESAVRQVLCATFGVDEPAGRERHRREVQSLIAQLGLPPDDPAAEAWLSIPSEEGGLQAWAHRRHLGRREIDSEFLRLWDDVQVFLDVVLARFEAASVRAFAMADRLLAIDPPTFEAIKSLMEEVPKAEPIVAHIARNVPISWFDALVTAGFFDGVPTVDNLGNGDSWERLRWPQIELLRRAAVEPSTRAEAWAVIVQVASRPNPPLHVELLDIALSGTSSEATQLEPFLESWLARSPDFLLIDRLVKLVEHLLAGGHIESAFTVSGLVMAAGTAAPSAAESH